MNQAKRVALSIGPNAPDIPPKPRALILSQGASIPEKIKLNFNLSATWPNPTVKTTYLPEARLLKKSKRIGCATLNFAEVPAPSLGKLDIKVSSPLCLGRNFDPKWSPAQEFVAIIVTPKAADLDCV